MIITGIDVLIRCVAMWLIEAPSLVKSAREKLVREGDTVVLECMSQSTGSARTRVEWLKDGRRLSPTDSYRLHLAADSQLLVVTQAHSLDAGVYTCVASNSLGTERAVSKLTVISNGNKHGDFFNVGTDGSRSGDRHDVTMRVGLAIMAGVAGVVLTSFIWVVVIYCLRRRRGVSDTTSSTTSSTSDTIVVGAGTSSDLSFCASPVSSWMLDSTYSALCCFLLSLLCIDPLLDDDTKLRSFVTSRMVFYGQMTFSRLNFVAYKKLIKAKSIVVDVGSGRELAALLTVLT